MKRSLAVGLVVVAIAAGCGVGWVLASRRHHPTEPPPGPVSSPSASPSPSPSPSTGASAGTEFITFGASDGTINTRSQVAKLRGTTTAFQLMIADEVAQQHSWCSTPDTGVSVERYAPSGFAVGGLNGCGGARALWTNEYGSWQRLITTQDAWHCPELRRYHVPDGLIKDCAEPETTPTLNSQPAKIVSFHDPAHPGMGIFVQKTADAKLLRGTSASFQDFIGTTAQEMTDANTAKKTCDDGGVGITVGAYATNGYAIGAVNDCGGNEAIWGDVGYGWQELIGTQSEFVCQQLHDNGVPVALVPGDDTNGNVGMCFDAVTKKSIRYQG